MPYSAEISRQNPSCFVFVIDQSGSMADPFKGGEIQKRKADGVADAINNFLRNLTIRCAKPEGVRPYFHIGVIGYGSSVGPAFTGRLSGRELVPINEIADGPARVEERTIKTEDGAGGLVEEKKKFPIWFDPISNGGTPMCNAFGVVEKVVRTFIDSHPGCFPPVVIHFTDGESTDGDPTAAMKAVTAQASSDGNALLFNCHISSLQATPIAFPHSEDVLPDMYAKMLFQNASELTPYMRDIAKSSHGFDLQPGAKGFTFNADLILVIQALDIGTRPSELR
jgi:hypothetical protein